MQYHSEACRTSQTKIGGGITFFWSHALHFCIHLGMHLASLHRLTGEPKNLKPASYRWESSSEITDLSKVIQQQHAGQFIPLHT